MNCDSCKATLLEPKNKHMELEKTITGPLNSKAAYIINIYRYRMILLPHVVNFLPHKPQHVQLDELRPERSSSQCEISTYHCS